MIAFGRVMNVFYTFRPILEIYKSLALKFFSKSSRSFSLSTSCFSFFFSFAVIAGLEDSGGGGKDSWLLL